MYEWIPLLLGNCTDSSDEYCEPIPPYKGNLHFALFPNITELQVGR